MNSTYVYQHKHNGKLPLPDSIQALYGSGILNKDFIQSIQSHLESLSLLDIKQLKLIHEEEDEEPWLYHNRYLAWECGMWTIHLDWKHKYDGNHGFTKERMFTLEYIKGNQKMFRIKAKDNSIRLAATKAISAEEFKEIRQKFF